MSRPALPALALTLADLDEICDLTRAGGYLTDWADEHGVEPHQVHQWIAATPERRAIYDAASYDQAEAWRTDLRQRMHALTRYDARDLVDPDTGALLPPSAWPEGIALAVVGLKVSGTGAVTVKLSDRLRAMELLGRDLGLFRERVDVSVTINVADKLKAARARARILEHEPAPTRPTLALDPSIETEGGGGGISAGTPPHPHSLAQKKSATQFPEVSGPASPETVGSEAGAGEDAGLPTNEAPTPAPEDDL